MTCVSKQCSTALSHLLMFSATGGMVHTANIFYKRLASLLPDKWKDPYVAVLKMQTFLLLVSYALQSNA